jgi:geranylgeranyl diphosphate synthase type II
MRHAVFPGGARVRPRLCLAVAAACGGVDQRLAEAAAAAIELLHCASLVHDDLPCFDDAATRRGRPSVHRAHGQPLAVLAGDALIVLSFQIVARAAARAPAARLATLVAALAEAVGAPHGLCAGQAWESEAQPDLAAYQRAKTGALFAAATIAGAAAAGHEAPGWRQVGERLGEAYQVADDIGDAAGDADELGKPIGQDAALGRPNAVHALGIAGALARLQGLADAAIAAIPPCAGAAELGALIRLESKRLVPKRFAQSAA